MLDDLNLLWQDYTGAFARFLKFRLDSRTGFISGNRADLYSA